MSPRWRCAALVVAAVIAASCSSSSITPDAAPAEPTTASAPTATPLPDPVEPTPAPTPTAAVSTDAATLVFTGGTVLTMDDTMPVAEAVAVQGDTIVAVGTESEIAELIGPETVTVDLDGRALLPGFVDAHAHYLVAFELDVAAAQDLLLAEGITTAAEMTVMPDQLPVLLQADADGAFRVRTSVYLAHNDPCGDETGDWMLDVEPTRNRGERLRIGGIKVFSDGGACNAPAISYEFAFGGSGDLYFDADSLAEVVGRYDAAGYQVAVHALGDRAVAVALDAMQSVIGTSGNPRRHRIEHNAVVPPELRGRYDEAGAVAMIFGTYATCAYLGLDDRFRFITPAEFQPWEWPWRDLLDQNPNTHFAWHGDFPVFADSSPLGSLAGFVTRRQVLDDGTECEPEPFMAAQAITADEALHLMTIGAAYALDRETEVGSLEVGKLADLVVLSADPLAAGSPAALADLAVELTVLDGEPAFCQGAFASLCGETAPPATDPSAPVSASTALPTNPPEHAIDGDVDTWWGAGDDAPQWIEVDLGERQMVTGVKLLTDQFPAGFTRHVVYGRDATGDLVTLGELAGETDTLQELVVTFDQPAAVNAIRIETVESPSWVSWREIEIMTDDL